jgi:hypothetical protein
MTPDPSKVSSGRLNPRGIACLYLADRRETAIAEVRPWVSATVSVGVFEVLRDLKIVDCTVGRKDFTLFFKPPPETEWDEIVWSNIDGAFLRPTDPDDSHLTYAPTQLIAEVLRDAGYDGIAYRSGLHKGGTNFALFELDVARLFACQLFDVKKVSYDCDESAQGYSVGRLTGTPPVGREGG